MSEANFEQDRALAYEEGRVDFFRNRDRKANPYRNTNAELAAAWWRGWDEAKALALTWQSSQELNTWDKLTKSKLLIK